MFKSVPPFPGDPILSLMEVFVADSRPTKVNLCIGVYQTEEGKIPVLPVVSKAEQELAKQVSPRGYLPMDGHAGFKEGVRHTVFGPHADAITDRLAVIQTIGGSGALKVGADFIKRFLPSSEVWICDPTWDNHHAIFQQAGVIGHTYPYFDPEKGELVFDAMVECLNTLPARSIVLLQPSCHNPTGADLTEEQWQTVIKVLKERNLLPFMDMAYQGLGQGFDEDAYAIRALAEADIPFFASCSFSKNMSLYGERCGALMVYCKNHEEKERVLGQLKACVRTNYSSPPTHGAVVFAKILQNEEARQEWKDYVAHMRSRIRGARQALYNALRKRSQKYDFEYVLKQKGMFSYTGLSVDQVDRLREEFGIYVVRSGRICVAAINAKNVDYIADSFIKVLDSE